jgi:23S rRNA pseudouridine1911/1915/1917 synthase
MSNAPPEQPSPEQTTPSWIIVEDGPVIVVNKPSGIVTEGPGDTVVARVKAHLKKKYDKAGNVYVGIPHRLDRDTTGALMFTRNSKTAARVSEQFRDRTVQKIYWVLLETPPTPASGDLCDWLVKDSAKSFVEVCETATDGAKEAKLSYDTIEVRDCVALVRVELQTGRTHQIRVQFSSRGFAVRGDLKYGGTAWDAGSSMSVPNANVRLVGLHAISLRLKHPIRYDDMEVRAPLPEYWPDWTHRIFAALSTDSA